jgi:polysaccharide export outer membrane protein
MPLDRLMTPTTITALPELSGYLVNPDGTLELPLIGKVPVGGLTTAQVADRIREKLKEYLKEPTVNIRNQNFRVSVMGEVARPSLFTIPNEKITMLEALSLAGDITIYGRRDNVLLIREVNGLRTFTRIDLTNRDLFRSPYFYLRPNDVIYVEPGRARVASADRTYQLLPIALSALSFLAIIFSRFN